MDVNFKKIVSGSFASVLEKTEAALQAGGFGVLTRIDFAGKIKEKLGHDLPPILILGACNPKVAYEAFQKRSDVTSLLPCNVVLRELEPGRVSIEVARPSALMQILDDPQLSHMAVEIDGRLVKILDSV